MPEPGVWTCFGHQGRATDFSWSDKASVFKLDLEKGDTEITKTRLESVARV